MTGFFFSRDNTSYCTACKLAHNESKVHEAKSSKKQVIQYVDKNINPKEFRFENGRWTCLLRSEEKCKAQVSVEQMSPYNFVIDGCTRHSCNFAFSPMVMESSTSWNNIEIPLSVDYVNVNGKKIFRVRNHFTLPVQVLG